MDLKQPRVGPVNFDQCYQWPLSALSGSMTLPTDFPSPSENGHSRYGQLTARFAP